MRTALVAALLSTAFAACGNGTVDPPVEEGTAFAYSPPSQAPEVTSVSVRGDFNDWGESPMERQSDGSWRALIDLEEGTYEYKYFINESWPTDMCDDQTWGRPDHDHWIDPTAAGCVPDGHGGQNAVAIIGDQPGLLFAHDPNEAVYVSGAGGSLSIRFRARLGAVDSATATADGNAFAMHRQLTFGLQEVWRVALPEGTTRYSFRVATADGAETFGPYTAPADLFSAVEWVGDAIGYQIFPERFWNGDPGNDSATLATDVVNYMHPDTWSIEPVLSETWGGEMADFHCCHQYFGGDIQGILDRMSHLEELGVTLLYLNPIFTSGSAHGYDTYDYMEVAPNFGDSVLLRQFLDAAHARGMRVMWDFVPNHVGVGFWAFQEAVEKGDTSQYWDWFNFKVPHSQVQVGNGNHYEAWWGFGTLPRLETRNPEVVEHLLEATRYWTEFGFDGIRVDVPMEIRNRSEFFPAFREAAKAVDAEVYLIGEVWERDPSWLRGDQFDGLMNYALGEGVVERFARGHMTAAAAAQEMAALYAAYPEAAAAMLFNLISSHDTARLLTKLGGGRLGGTPGAEALARQRLASAMLYALPGVPVTFQGDECAFLGSGDGPREENRYPLQWQECDPAMVDHYRHLAGLRADLPAIASPVLRTHEATGSILSFYRGEPGAGEMLAVFNNGAEPATLPLPEAAWVDAATGETLGDGAAVEPMGWRYLRRN